MWSPKFSESVDRRIIHQLTVTCKTNKKTTMVFSRPSDGKISLILKNLKLRTLVISIKNLVPFLMRLALLLWKEKKESVFFGE